MEKDEVYEPPDRTLNRYLDEAFPRRWHLVEEGLDHSGLKPIPDRRPGSREEPQAHFRAKRRRDSPKDGPGRFSASVLDERQIGGVDARQPGDRRFRRTGVLTEPAQVFADRSASGNRGVVCPSLESRRHLCSEPSADLLALTPFGAVRSGRLRDRAAFPRLPGHGHVGSVVRCSTETALGLFDRQDRRTVAVVVTSDGRRVQVPMNNSGLADVSLLGLLRSLLLGLDGLLGLITGSRRENGGTRRDER
jgi:hypothetical protein